MFFSLNSNLEHNYDNTKLHSILTIMTGSNLATKS